MRLIVSYYQDKNPDRQAEIDKCLQNNLKCKSITEIIILIDNPNVRFQLPEPETHTETLWVKHIHYRPTFDVMMSYSAPDKWNIIANSDIYFDESLEEAKKYTKGHFLALARHDVLKSGEVKLLNQPDAQDAWIYFGTPNHMVADFHQGIPGCDNALAHKANQSGYRVVNPSMTVKAYHLHNSNVRSYNPNIKVPEPYKLIWPHT